jgi:ribosomal protein L37E
MRRSGKAFEHPDLYCSQCGKGTLRKSRGRDKLSDV